MPGGSSVSARSAGACRTRGGDLRIVDEAGLEAALAALGPEPRVVLGGNAATPGALLGCLDRACERARIFILNPLVELPTREGLTVETPFVGPGARGHPQLEYFPMRLSLVPRSFNTTLPPDAVCVQLSTPRNGKVSLGVEVNVLPAAIETVRRRGGLVVGQLNASMPYTYGDAELAVDDVDVAIEHDAPIMVCGTTGADEPTSQIAARVATYARDGATLQCGIGRVPDAVCSALRDRRSLRVWSEMVSDGVLGLERAGCLDGSSDIVASFLGGSSELYEWAHLQERLRLRRTEVVNDPGRIAQHDGMLSVNAALEIDLFDQANASVAGTRVHSGFGGQPDFVSGALHAQGGHAIVALHAWHDKTDASTIVPLLRVPATSFQHSVVVTEHGAAELFGVSRAEQARRLIDRAAAPAARDHLHAAARDLGLHLEVRGSTT